MSNRPYTLCLILLLLSACASPVAEPTGIIPATDIASLVIPTSTEPAHTETSSSLESGYYPLSTRTGLAEIDAVIAAVESGNPQELRDLIRFTTVACTKADGLGGPPKCQGDETEGTPVEVLPFLGPEGHFLRKAELPNFPGVSVIGIYAAYKASETAYSEEAYPAGEYAVMFKGGENQPDVVFQVRDGVVRIDYLYQPTSLNVFIQRDAAQMILVPQQ